MRQSVPGVLLSICSLYPFALFLSHFWPKVERYAQP
jgi:hypothetical protein